RACLWPFLDDGDNMRTIKAEDDFAPPRGAGQQRAEVRNGGLAPLRLSCWSKPREGAFGQFVERERMRPSVSQTKEGRLRQRRRRGNRGAIAALEGIRLSICLRMTGLRLHRR